MYPVEASHRSGVGQLKTISVRARKKDWSSAHPYLHCARMTDGPIWPLITEKLRTGGAEIESLASSNQESILYTACKPIKKPGRAQIRSAVVSSPKPCGQGCSCSRKQHSLSMYAHYIFALLSMRASPLLNHQIHSFALIM